VAQSPTDPLARKEERVLIAVSRLNCLDIFELQPAGRRDEARTILEGFETRDLNDAKALPNEFRSD
jgi:hypothetical protein